LIPKKIQFIDDPQIFSIIVIIMILIDCELFLLSS